jgi:hypothetical protein
MDAVLKAHYVNALLRLSRATGLYPEWLALKGIQMEAAPVDRGGFGDVYKGVLHGKVIAVKALRVYQTSNIVQLLKVVVRAWNGCLSQLTYICRASRPRQSCGSSFLTLMFYLSTASIIWTRGLRDFA